MNKQRLLNAAKAVRETPSPGKFSMSRFGLETYPVPQVDSPGCGTPGCVLGHYAARADLQDEFKLVGSDIFLRDAVVPENFWERGGNGLTYNADVICDHFQISSNQACQLFSTAGCEYAQTPWEAANYIERFVEEEESYQETRHE